MDKAIERQRKVWFTPHPKLKQAWCGHKLDATRFPQINCNQCWTFYFIHNAKLTAAIAEDIKAGNFTSLTNQFGAKVVKKAKWFFAEVAKHEELNKELHAEMEQEIQDREYDVVLSADAEDEVNGLKEVA